jgi:ribosomal protein L37E
MIELHLTVSLLHIGETMAEDNRDKQLQPQPEKLYFQRSPVVCRRCSREFAHFMIEEIDDLAQLRCGDVLLARAEMACLHCGWVFYWNIREKDFEKMTLAYNELSKRVSYAPE